MKTDREVQELFQAYQKCGAKGRAGMKAKMSRNTASKHINSGSLPSATKVPRTWRTREDAFAGVWEAVERWLRDVPELEAKAMLEHLSGENPEVFQEGQLRTFQRRVREWRAMRAPVSPACAPVSCWPPPVLAHPAPLGCGISESMLDWFANPYSGALRANGRGLLWRQALELESGFFVRHTGVSCCETGDKGSWNR